MDGRRDKSRPECGDGVGAAVPAEIEPQPVVEGRADGAAVGAGQRRQRERREGFESEQRFGLPLVGRSAFCFLHGGSGGLDAEADR